MARKSAIFGRLYLDYFYFNIILGFNFLSRCDGKRRRTDRKKVRFDHF